jgi:hypothetical protein
MGTQNPQLISEAGQARNQRRQNGAWVSPDTAADQYFGWTQKARDDFRAKGLLGGLLNKAAGDLEAYALWQGLVKQGALYGANGQMVSPMDILAGYVKGNSAGGQWVKQGDFQVNPLTGEKRYVGPQFKTTSQTRVDLTDPATARATATQIFQQLLGRDPGANEIAAYASALSASEQQNPGRETTTTQYDLTTGEPISTSAVSSGGMTDAGRAQLAQDEVKGKSEYATTQAATTYANALERAVYGGPR